MFSAPAVHVVVPFGQAEGQNHRHIDSVRACNGRQGLLGVATLDSFSVPKKDLEDAVKTSCDETPLNVPNS